MSISQSKIDSGMLGLAQLRNLFSREELRTRFRLEVQDIDNFHARAIRSGDTSWFVRWVTDQLLIFRASDNEQETRVVHLALEMLRPVIDELERKSTLEQNFVQFKGLLEAEVDRFDELGSLLQQTFDLIHESLCLDPGSMTGTKEIVTATHEMDIAYGGRVAAVREHSSFQRDKASISDSFRIVSTAAMEQLYEWHLPLRLEIALSTMLEVLPKLEKSVFSKININAWGQVLVRHGMQKAATDLTAAVREKRAASKRTTSRRAAQNYPYHGQARNRTPRQPAFPPTIASSSQDSSEDSSEDSMDERDAPAATPRTVVTSRNSTASTQTYKIPRVPRSLRGSKSRPEVIVISSDDESSGDEETSSDEESRGEGAIIDHEAIMSQCEESSNDSGGFGDEEMSDGEGLSSEWDSDGDEQMTGGRDLNEYMDTDEDE
jgi:hypothetical protein